MADPTQTRQVAAYPTLKLDREIPLIDVASVLGIPHPPQSPPFPVTLVDALGGTFGLIFNRLLARQEIVIKNLGTLLDRVPCCAGATLLGERCALILDVPALVRRALESPQGMLSEDQSGPGGANLLVVEDSDMLREDLYRLLSGAGYNVFGARDGAEALSICTQRRIDLISTDVMMPEVDGYELCRRLRQLPDYQDVPIIMLTSRDQEIDRIRGFDAGVDAYLVKPVSREQLLDLVQKLLADPLLDDQSAAQAPRRRS
jgi:two-component system chemotaxis sensor kinase CheA